VPTGVDTQFFQPKLEAKKTSSNLFYRLDGLAAERRRDSMVYGRSFADYQEKIPQVSLRSSGAIRFEFVE
jgi:hypothetical protein